MGFTLIMKFIGKNWKVIALAVAILACIAYVNNLKTTAQKWQNDYITLHGKFEAAKVLAAANIAILEDSIRNQNTKITELNNELRAKAALVDKYEKAAAKKELEHKTELELIASEVVPKTCTGSMKYLLDSGEGLNQW